MQVILFSKKWWNKKIVETCKIWVKKKKIYEKMAFDREKLK